MTVRKNLRGGVERRGSLPVSRFLLTIRMKCDRINMYFFKTGQGPAQGPRGTFLK